MSGNTNLPKTIFVNKVPILRLKIVITVLRIWKTFSANGTVLKDKNSCLLNAFIYFRHCIQLHRVLTMFQLNLQKYLVDIFDTLQNKYSDILVCTGSFPEVTYNNYSKSSLVYSVQSKLLFKYHLKIKTDLVSTN